MFFYILFLFIFLEVVNLKGVSMRSSNEINSIIYVVLIKKDQCPSHYSLMKDVCTALLSKYPSFLDDVTLQAIDQSCKAALNLKP